MLKLKLQYFGHLMRRTDSLEKTLMLGKITENCKRLLNTELIYRFPEANFSPPLDQQLHRWVLVLFYFISHLDLQFYFFYHMVKWSGFKYKWKNSWPCKACRESHYSCVPQHFHCHLWIPMTISMLMHGHLHEMYSRKNNIPYQSLCQNYL